jgi:hypothetical protein
MQSDDCRYARFLRCQRFDENLLDNDRSIRFMGGDLLHVALMETESSTLPLPRRPPFLFTIANSGFDSRQWAARRLTSTRVACYANTMATYYKCLRGDSVHLGMIERDAFVVRDTRGRNWICFPIPQRKVENLTLLAHLADVVEADAAAGKQGLRQEGTEVRIYCCEEETELADKLAFDPPVDPTEE